MRLAWPPPWHLTASVLVSILALVLVHLSPEQVQDFGAPLGLILAIFIPGYLLVLALFPAGSDLTGKRRALLSFGFDAILIVLVCMILMLTPRGLQPASLATILSLLSLFLCAVAHARWSALPRRRRFVILSNSGFRTSKALARTITGKGKHSAVHFALLVVAIFAIAAFAYAINMYQGTREDAGSTEFHVSLLRGDDASLKAGSLVTAQAQIINHENRAIDYAMWLVLNGSTVLRKNLTLSRNETWKGPVSFILNGQAGEHRLDFLLFKDYDYSAPSQEDHLWINLSEDKSTQNTSSEKSSPVANEQSGKVSVLSTSKGSSQVDYKPSGGGSVSASTGKSPKSSSKTAQESRTIQETDSAQSRSNEEVAQEQSSILSSEEVTNPATESLKENQTINGSNASKTSISFTTRALANQTALSAANISYPMEKEIKNLSSNLPPYLVDFYPDVHSPQIEGTTVLWTANASDPEGDPIFYRFLLNGIEMTDWSAANSWTWNTSSAAPGDYKIGVLARDGEHAPEGSFDDSMNATFTLLPQNQPPTLLNLIPDKASPQEQGVTVFWKTDSLDPDGDRVQYKFLLDGREVRRWSKSNSWSWTTADLPAGDYKIGVLVRDDEHAPEGSFDDSMNVSFTLRAPNQKPVIQELRPDVPSPQESGIGISWTAAAKDAEGDPISYRFLLNGIEMTDWSAANSWTWNTSSASPGDYKIGVLARDDKHAPEGSFDDSMNVSFTLTAPNQKPVIQELRPDVPSPQESGNSISWTAAAKDAEGDPISYRFLLNGIEMTDWSAANSWTWNTSSASPGDYKIGVLARDDKHAPEGSFEDSMEASFAIKASNRPPALLSLTPDKPSPQVRGTTVVWKADASDPDGDIILYRFLVNNKVRSLWSKYDSWSWSTANMPDGNYHVSVQIRDSRHAGEESFDGSVDQSFTLISEIDQQIDQIMKNRTGYIHS